jgi:hypothetical protein
MRQARHVIRKQRVDLRPAVAAAVLSIPCQLLKMQNVVHPRLASQTATDQNVCKAIDNIGCCYLSQRSWDQESIVIALFLQVGILAIPSIMKSIDTDRYHEAVSPAKSLNKKYF